MMLTMLAAAAIAVTPAPQPAPIQVMVLGTYHFGNPGRDKVNVRVDDVTTPHRQRELEALAESIATFKPTRVMVEVQRPGPSYDVADFTSFSPALLRTDRDETTQIGYRVASRVGLRSVQGIDEQPGKGEPDYFPIGRVETYAKVHGEQAYLDAAFARVQASAHQFEKEQATTSIPKMLIRYNDPSTPMGGQDSYYSMLRFGDGDDQPGADLNAMWYLRNAKIFAKLINVAKPGDRILVVYGAGHGYWLRHFAATTPGYELVDVTPYLQRAADQIR
ncbi:DUF5694 domain-containing protein [Sphingomonas sp. CARO-RG-8B-R24-01]|uniref:DUF5694 domain-containing protein n=1 Tax=Sphingomonas sp. CARO-RG-8B-R24-01 TaxID=2914831 RepID=UPI001F5A981D|nr:DUF5694 domain-containing protein [Sphingomonas sp. CARO-RG-8B-R24-01]